MPGAQTREENACEGMAREALVNEDAALTATELASKYGRGGEHPLYDRDEWTGMSPRPHSYWGWVQQELAQDPDNNAKPGSGW